MYKVVAMDLDGTLFNQHRKISVRNLKALEECKKQGIYLVIASGRTYRDICDLTAQSGIEQYDRGYIIGYNGVLAAKTNPFTVTYKKMIHAEDVRRIAEFAEPFGLKLHVFCEKKVYLSENIEYLIESDSSLMLEATRVKMTSYQGDDEVYKVLILDDEEKLDSFQKMIPQSLNDQYTIFKSASHLLEFVHKLGSKGDALKEVVESLGLSRNEVIAFGDEENDITMLQYAGLGIAMENAKLTVKNAASAMTLSNKLDGVADAINKYILMGDDKNGI